MVGSSAVGGWRTTVVATASAPGRPVGRRLVVALGGVLTSAVAAVILYVARPVSRSAFPLRSWVCGEYPSAVKCGSRGVAMKPRWGSEAPTSREWRAGQVPSSAPRPTGALRASAGSASRCLRAGVRTPRMTPCDQIAVDSTGP